MSDKKYISKITKDGYSLYIKDIEAQQNISSHAGNTSNPHSVTKSQVGLSNVTNDAQVKRSEMGAASGVATLDSAGKVPASQLPSYIDDVLEYDTKSAFPETGEAGKIYVDKSTNTSWRWSGTTYVQIKGDLVIGTTTGTAADGGIANTHYNNTSNPHSVTKAQVGLGSVVNTGDSATPVSGGTTKFTTGGAYTELNKKVDKVSGKGLSTNDYTTDEKNKLAGIAAGAEVNVQSDWNATSGDAFIKNKPTIPSEVTESTVSGWGFTKNAGTITGIKMNGASKGTSGVVDLGTVITAHQDISGKVDKTTTVNGHALSDNVSVTKSDVGLGNVGNFKAVSTVASQGLSDTEKANARANIGAGTSSFSGSYNDLSNKPTIPAAAANGTYTVKTLVGSTTTNVSDFTANQSSADDVTFVQGSNVTITPDDTNRQITIAATNTKNTTGTSNKTGIKMFLAAATEQSANPVTYSNSNCYIGTDNCLYSGGAKVLTSHDGNNRKAFYGTCETVADTKDKVVTLAESAGWPGLVAGVIVGVKFTNTNSYNNATANPITLNVNSTGAKNIWFGNTHSGAGNTGTNTTAYGRASYVNYYMYDGTYWAWLSSSSDNNTTYSPLSLGFCYGTCSTAANTAAKTVTMKNYTLVAHGIIAIKFNNAITVASATLNINSKGAKAIYYKEAALAANVIQAGDIVTMQYNGSQYHIISIIRNSGLPKTDLSSEVQESLTKADETQFSTAYIGAGANASAVAVAANLKSNLRRGANTFVTASSNKLWILTPLTYADPTILMSGVEVPMTAQSNTTVSGVTYKVWSSNNTYTGTFNIQLF